MKKSFFYKKNILITGITGFIGSHLAKRLQQEGANVYGISRKESRKNIIKIDVTNYNAVNSFIEKMKIDICFHLAAEALVEEGQENPYKTFHTNIQGTLNILESARKNNLEKVIITSTAHVYGDNALPYLEKYTPRPTRPYETSKTCTDIIAQSYADSFQLPVLIPRFVNIYGPGDNSFNRLIPKTILSILLGDAPTMWGGTAIREYLFINDAINAYLALATHNLPETKSNRIFNFGTGKKTSVEDIIHKIITLSGKKVKIIKVSSGKRADEISKQYVSWSKAKKILRWKPRVDLDDGLKETIEWYKTQLRKTKHT